MRIFRKLAHHLTLLAGLSVTLRLVLSCCCSLRLLFVATATLSFEELLNNFLKTAFILSSRLFFSSRLKELQFHLIIFFATPTVYAFILYYFLSHYQHCYHSLEFIQLITFFCCSLNYNRVGESLYICIYGSCEHNEFIKSS